MLAVFEITTFSHILAMNFSPSSRNCLNLSCF
jgi:hypothetical protein